MEEFDVLIVSHKKDFDKLQDKINNKLAHLHLVS